MAYAAPIGEHTADTFPVALFTINEGFSVTGFNPCARRLFELTGNLQGGPSLAQLCPPLFTHVSNTLKKSAAGDCLKDFSPTTLNIASKTLQVWLGRIHEGEERKYLCAVSEMAEQTLPQPALSIEKKILDCLSIVAVAVNGAGEIVYFSPSIERVMGYTVAEVLGSGWWIASSVDGKPRTAAREEYARYARGEATIESVREVEYRHKDGSPRWMLWNFAKGPDDLLVGVGQDITSRNIERLELEKKTLQLTALIESSPLGIVITDTSGLVTTCNLANLNTVGYKQTRTTFRDMFYQNVGSSGSGNPIQIGAGAAVGSVSTIFSGSNIETSGVPTDVAISGEGFFVVEKDGVTRYTRAGNFTTSANGTLSTENGEQVLGYPSVDGVIDPSQGLVPLQMGKGQISPPNATGMVEMRTNLDATSAVGSSFNSPMTVYDSLGSSHVVNFRFTKTAANTWNYDITLPAADSGSPTDTSLATGTLQFDGGGALTSPATNVMGITTPALANGANPIRFDWNLFEGGSGMLTQLAAASSTASKHQDGFGSGTLEEFTIGSDGIVQGSFSNGKTMAIGQLVLANFPNTQGLLRAGNNDFEATLASGLPAIGAPGTGGRGSVAGGALELSNVDIASEFAKMIVAQRGFQANARAVTTFDEITQETINLKR